MINNKPRVLIVDGNNMLCRSIYVHPDLSNSDGEYTGGCYGLLKTLQQLKPLCDELVVVFDGKNGSSYRRKKYPEYKTNRTYDEEFTLKRNTSYKQSIELLTALGINNVFIDGLEADDLIYALSDHYNNLNYAVTVVSGDNDFLQLLNFGVMIYQPIPKIWIDSIVFQEKYGYHPKFAVLAKALNGDNSDNIKGVNGVGAKTIAKIMNDIKEPTIESVIEWASLGKPSKIKEKLSQSKSLLELNTSIIDLAKSGLPADLVAQRCVAKMSLIHKADLSIINMILTKLGFASLIGWINNEFN